MSVVFLYLYSLILFGVKVFGIKLYVIASFFVLLKVNLKIFLPNIQARILLLYMLMLSAIGVTNLNLGFSIKSIFSLLILIAVGPYLERPKFNAGIKILINLAASVIILSYIIDIQTIDNPTLSVFFYSDRGSGFSGDPNKAITILLLLSMLASNKIITNKSWALILMSIIFSKSRLAGLIAVLSGLVNYLIYRNRYLAYLLLSVSLIGCIALSETIYNSLLLLSYLLRPELENLQSLDSVREQSSNNLIATFLAANWVWGAGLENFVAEYGHPPHNGIYSIMLVGGKIGLITTVLTMILTIRENYLPQYVALYLIYYFIEFIDFPLFFLAWYALTIKGVRSYD